MMGWMMISGLWCVSLIFVFLFSDLVLWGYEIDFFFFGHDRLWRMVKTFKNSLSGLAKRKRNELRISLFERANRGIHLHLRLRLPVDGKTRKGKGSLWRFRLIRVRLVGNGNGEG